MVLERGAWLFGTVTDRLAIRADRRNSTPFKQGESGSKRPDSNPGAFFGQNALIVCVASMRIRPWYPCTLLFPSVSAPYVLHHRELDTLTVCTPSVQVRWAEEGKATHNVQKPRALRARLVRAGT